MMDEKKQLQWLTIPEFENTELVNMYHREGMPVSVPNETRKNVHVLARTLCNKQNDDARYVLRVTADDYYKLYINGKYCCQGPAPSYVEHYFYNEIDITSYLKDGDNVIGLHLYYQGLVNRVWNSGDGRFGMAAELEVNGVSTTLNWKYCISDAYSGDTVGYDTQFLENFDSRLWQEDWCLVGYNDSEWKDMIPAKWADYQLFLQPTEMLQVYSIEPERIEKRNDGLFVDVGQEITGGLCITARGKCGSCIRIQCGEELDHDGNVRYEMRCNCVYDETFILNGKETQFMPYDYKAFRYAQLIFSEETEIIKIEVQVRHYPLNERLCTLECSNSLLEKIFKICKNGVKYGTQEEYLDCPSREKGQYMGDAIITARSQVWMTGSTDLLRKYIQQSAMSEFISPALMAVVPGAKMQEIADFSLLWSQLLLLDYEFTGDLKFLEEYYPTALRIVQYFSKFQQEDGLLAGVDTWNLVDWPANLRDGYDFCLDKKALGKGKHNVINALYIGALKTLSEIETLLNIPVTYNWKGLRDTFYNVFYRKSTGLFADTEYSMHSAIHSNIYPLYFGLIREEHRDVIATYLAERGFCCGVFISYFLLRGLEKAGYYQEIYQLIINETEHGWVNMLREGATTCWEAWGKEQKSNISLCHPWSSAPISVLIESLAGFRPDPSQSCGYTWEPHLPDELSYLKLSIPFRNQKFEIVKEKEAISCKKMNIM